MPDHWREARHKQHSTHALLAGIASAPAKRITNGDQFAEAFSPTAEGAGNEAKIVEAIERCFTEADSVTVAFLQGILQGGEMPTGTRESRRH